MGRPYSTKPLPEHPAIGSAVQVLFLYGLNRQCVEVTCPDCSESRWLPVTTVRQWLKNPRFKGHCRKCSMPAVREGHHRWKKKAGLGRSIASNGYVIVTAGSVADEDLPLFRKVLNGRTNVSEHRWVMAKQLGRPLETYEWVDHMDGVKTNNSPDNLRIYRCGMQDPGSNPGYGTYYHEWQMALARIAELEAKCAACR